VWNVKCASFLLGVGAFRPKFYGNGVTPCQNVDIVPWGVDCASTVPLKVFTQCQTFNSFCWKFLLTVTNLDIWTPFWKLRDDARFWLMTRWRAHARLSVCINWTFCIIYYSSRVVRQNVYSSAVFTGVDLFALKFYLDRVVPINHSWRQKTTDTGLPDSEDQILLRPSFWQNWIVLDRRTDGQTDGQINVL